MTVVPPDLAMKQPRLRAIAYQAASLRTRPTFPIDRRDGMGDATPRICSLRRAAEIQERVRPASGSASGAGIGRMIRSAREKRVDLAFTVPAVMHRCSTSTAD